MSNLFLPLALLLAVLDWIAVDRDWKTIRYFAKPGVMVALLAWLWMVSGFEGPLFWFTLGLLFSLAGDVFLMLPREQFIAGLVSFLLAHLAYVIGFTRSLPPANLVSLLLAIIVTVVAGRVYRRIAAGLVDTGRARLKAPVFTYTNVISLMLLTALLTLVRPDWSLETALLASSGAILFFISDATLAWNKFVQTLRHGNLVVIVTYHIGQMLIIVAAAIHYLS